MTQDSLGVAVIGAGMVGRAHAAGYRSATQLYDLDLPEVRLVAVADAYEPFAIDAAKRFGYERAVTSWQDIVDADDVDVVSVAIANELHRPVVEALLAAGKHVLCEKPLAPSVEDAAAMVAAADAADTQSGVGFSFRRTPGINAIRAQVEAGAIGELRHFNGHYWCDYALNTDAPISWRYKGGPGSGALADIGSHMIDLGEYVCGPITSVSGGTFQTFTTSRPVPVGAVVGHAAGGAVSDERDTVDNEDIATFTATFANGAVGTFSISRVAHGLPNGLGFEVFGADGAGRVSTSTTPVCSPSPTTAPVPRPTATGRCSSGPSTRASPVASRWTSPRSATARTTCSPGRRVPSSTRWPGSASSRPCRHWPTACTTCRSSRRSRSPR